MVRPSPRLKAAQDANIRALKVAIDAATKCGQLRREAHRSEEARDRFEAAHAEYMESRRALSEADERLREAERAERAERAKAPASGLDRLIWDVWRDLQDKREI